mgnify:CR=1 FL=1
MLGELENFCFVESYKGVSPALLLCFKNGDKFFVRSERFDEYIKIFNIKSIEFVDKTKK